MYRIDNHLSTLRQAADHVARRPGPGDGDVRRQGTEDDLRPGGASLEDSSGLFNSSLEGNTRRAIDFHEDDKIGENALTAFIRVAVALNMSVRATARPVRS